MLVLIRKSRNFQIKLSNKYSYQKLLKNGRLELGQQLQNKIISEIGENMQIYRIILGLNIPSGAKAENIAKTTFAKLGIAKPSHPLLEFVGNSIILKK